MLHAHEHSTLARFLSWTRPTPGSVLRRAAAMLSLTILVGTFGSILATARSGNPAGMLQPGTLPVWDLGLSPVEAKPIPPRRLCEVRVTVTGYSSTPEQTDSTPFITASNTRVRPGIVALSRDLLREFTPGAPFGFGDWIELRGVGRFRVEDTMSPRFTKRVDIWFASTETALRWGKQRRTLVRLLGTDEIPGGGLAHRETDPAVEFPLFEAALAD